MMNIWSDGKKGKNPANDCMLETQVDVEWLRVIVLGMRTVGFESLTIVISVVLAERTRPFL